MNKPESLQGLLHYLPHLATLVLIAVLAYQLALWTVMLTPLPAPRLHSTPESQLTASISKVSDARLPDARQIAD